MATTYICQFSEYQRDMVTWVLKTASNEPFIKACLASQNGDVENTKLAELDMFVAMLEELPKHEKANPGLIHGLCL
jgi:hypothetical protein